MPLAGKKAKVLQQVLEPGIPFWVCHPPDAGGSWQPGSLPAPPLCASRPLEAAGSASLRDRIADFRFAGEIEAGLEILGEESEAGRSLSFSRELREPRPKAQRGGGAKLKKKPLGSPRAPGGRLEGEAPPTQLANFGSGAGSGWGRGWGPGGGGTDPGYRLCKSRPAERK